MGLLLFAGSIAHGAPPIPVLNHITPSGGQAGTTVSVTVQGTNLTESTSLRCNRSDILIAPTGPNQFRLSIPSTVPPGQYDMQAVTTHGLSAVRTFVVSGRPEQPEIEPNQSLTSPQSIPLPIVLNGQIHKGDLDHFGFAAQQGQRIVIDCQSERIGSRLRAVLELYDSSGRRLAANRGSVSTDPLIDFIVPADGTYSAKVFDLVYSGSADHFYRLSIDAGPRVAYADPSVIERGKTTSVTLYGWNLGKRAVVDRSAINTPQILESITVDITPPVTQQQNTTRLRSTQVALDGFDYLYPGSDVPIFMGLSDVPVVRSQPGNQTAKTAYEISVPSEVSGQLIAGDEQDWFAISVRRGDVLWLEAFGERINSPVDLDVGVYDATGEMQLAAFHDELPAHQLARFSSSHLDPVGRWVAPADGRYLVLVRNLTGGLDNDPRRQYRLSVRREEPDFHLVAVPRNDSPVGLNVARGGTCALDVLAIRRRGMTGPIRVSAKNLPAGIESPDVWLGPNVDSAPLVITAATGAEPFVGTLDVEGHAEIAGTRHVRGGTVVLHNSHGISSRITDRVTFAVAGEAPLKLVADGHQVKKHHLYGDLKVRHSPGCIVDVVIEVERRDADHLPPVRLIGIGMPDLIANQTAIIPAGQNRGTISFYLPPTLPVGKYSLAVQGETTVPTGSKDPNGKANVETVTFVSNSVTLDVQPAAFIVNADPFAPHKIRRGEIVQLPYSVRRVNGFIGKIHTELDAPGEVSGLRGRGVTFVGQVDTGTIQIIASDDAPLGQQPFLRLYGVGTLEDQPMFHSSCFLNLEIVN